MGAWYYKLIEDENGAQLIKEFQEFDANLKFSAGYDDEEFDYHIFSEINDHTISFGRVLLFKFSIARQKVITDYLKEPKNKLIDYAKYTCQQIYNEQKSKNNQTFNHTLLELTDAFILSYIIHTVDSKGIFNVAEQNKFTSDFFDKASDEIRNFLKLEREYWDPTLNSQNYLYKYPTKAFNFFINKCNNAIEKLNDVKNRITLIATIFKSKIIYKIVDYFIECVNIFITFFTSLKTFLINFKNSSRIQFSFFCGIFNGLVEFICGFIDIGILLIKLENTNDKDYTLLIEVQEVFEEMVNSLIEKYKEDPEFLSKIFADALDKHIQEYYNDPNLTNYQIAHNVGEDLVLVIDIVVSIIAFIKGLSKVAQKLPKLTNWIDDILRRSKNIPKQITKVIEQKLIDDVEKGITKLDVDEFGKKRKPNDYTRHTNYSEMKIDKWFETQTFTINNRTGTLKRVSTKTITSLDEPITKGIDGVYEFSSPPPKYIITEVKYNTAKLDTKITKSGGTQMSEFWIEEDLKKGAVSPEIRRDILLNGYEPLLCHVAKDGKVTVNVIEQTQTTAKKGKLWNAIVK